MDEATPTDATLPVDPSTMGAVATAVGGTIGRFVVLDLLGQGAMGIVLAAYDPDLDRKVALKLLRPEALGQAEEGAERMLREARAMAKLSHPNVVAIHETGKIDGQIFLAMEFAAGGTLRGWCSAERRDWRAVLAKFVQAGRGLAAAHDAGLVHRDFKPTNVLLAANGDPRVADFGLVGVHATDAVQRSGLDLTLTHTGTLLGTPAFMAPEQHDRAEVSPAADQFAFCVSLWDALHGMPPFEGTTLQTLGDNVRANRVRTPPTSDVPPWLVAVMRRGLAVKPEDRWPSMDALLAALSNDPAVARRRRMRWALGTAAVMLLVGASTAFALTTRDDAPARPTCAAMDRDLAGVWDEPRRTALRTAFATSGHPSSADSAKSVITTLDAYAQTWVDARRTACEATHVHGDQSPELLDLRVACLDRHLVDAAALVDQFVGAPASGVVERAPTAVLRLTSVRTCDDTEALRTVGIPLDPAVRGQVAAIRAVSAAARALGDTGQAKVGLARAKEAVLAAETLGDKSTLADALTKRARLEQLTGDFATSRATLQAAIYAASEAHDDRLAATLWSSMIGFVSDIQMRPAEALQFVPAARAALLRAGNARANVAHHRGSVGRAMVSNGQLVEGHAMLVESLAMHEQIFGPDSYDVARELGAIGNALQDLGRHDESIAVLERSIAIRIKAFGPKHRDVLQTQANLANAYQASGRWEEARRRHAEVLIAFREVLGPEHPHVANTLVNLGNALEKLNQNEAALDNYQQAITLAVKVVGHEHGVTAAAYAAMAVTFAKLKRLDDSLAAIDHAIDIYEKLSMGENPLIAYALETKANTLLEMNRAAAALPLAERSLKIRVAADSGPELIAGSKLTVAHALLATGRERSRAMTYAAEANAFFETLRDGGKPFLDDVKWILAKYK